MSNISSVQIGAFKTVYVADDYSELEIIKIIRPFETSFVANKYIVDTFLPGWDTAQNGALPEYFYYETNYEKYIVRIQILQNAVGSNLANTAETQFYLYEIYKDMSLQPDLTGEIGATGESAFELYNRINESNLTEVEFLQTLSGATGASVFDIWKAVNNLPDATEQEFLDSLSVASNAGSTQILFSTRPVVQGFDGNELKEFTFNNSVFSNVDKNTNVTDDLVSGDLLLPTAKLGQVNRFVIEFFYDQKGGLASDEDIGVVFQLCEYDNYSEQDSYYVEHVCSKGNNREGHSQVVFDVVSNTDVVGTGKGYKLKILGKESDNNFRFHIDRITRYAY